MPIMDGISALKQIKQSSPKTCILMLTTFVDTEYIVEAMASGASGYMPKDMNWDKMIASIRDAVSGQFILPSDVAKKLSVRVQQFTSDLDIWRKSNPERITLTEREKKLGQLMIKGLSNREIAEMMNIGEGTVRNYISNLYSKLDVVDRAQAILRLQYFYLNL